MHRFVLVLAAKTSKHVRCIAGRGKSARQCFGAKRRQRVIDREAREADRQQFEKRTVGEKMENRTADRVRFTLAE